MDLVRSLPGMMSFMVRPPGAGVASPRLMMPCTAACSAARHPGSGASRSAPAPWNRNSLASWMSCSRTRGSSFQSWRSRARSASALRRGW